MNDLLGRGCARKALVLAASLSACLPSGRSVAQVDEVDLQVINRIVYEGMNHSEIPQLASYLTDRIGARLANSPQMRQAERWTQERFRSFGLSDVRAEGFEFGRGWSFENVSVRMLSPRVRVLRSIPVAWTPGTAGAVRGKVIVAPLATERDLEKWRGGLRGRVVLIERPTSGPDAPEPVDRSLTEEDLSALDRCPQPKYSKEYYAEAIRESAFERRRDQFLAEEGALAWLAPSDSGGRTTSCSRGMKPCRSRRPRQRLSQSIGTRYARKPK
jgi:carboxypeptidase Q